MVVELLPQVANYALAERFECDFFPKIDAARIVVAKATPKMSIKSSRDNPSESAAGVSPSAAVCGAAIRDAGRKTSSTIRLANVGGIIAADTPTITSSKPRPSRVRWGRTNRKSFFTDHYSYLVFILSATVSEKKSKYASSLIGACHLQCALILFSMLCST